MRTADGASGGAAPLARVRAPSYGARMARSQGPSKGASQAPGASRRAIFPLWESKEGYRRARAAQRTGPAERWLSRCGCCECAGAGPSHKTVICIRILQRFRLPSIYSFFGCGQRLDNSPYSIPGFASSCRSTDIEIMRADKTNNPQLCAGFRVLSGGIRRRPWITLTVMLLPVLLITTVGALNYNGYCISRGEFLPDDEFMSSAIRQTITFDAGRPISIGNRDGHEQFARSIPYVDESDFRSQNPNCCEFRTTPPLEYLPISVVDRLIGSASKIVSVTFFQRYRNQEGSIDTRSRTDYVTVGNCGVVLNVGR